MPKLATPKAPLVFANAKPKDRPYIIPDGKGLCLLVTPEGSKRWIFRYRVGGKEKKLAIRGGYPAVSLKAAREEADRFRAFLSQGEDPGALRRMVKVDDARKEEVERKEQVLAAETFERVAQEWHTRTADQRVPGYNASVLIRLEQNIFPWLGKKPISEIQPTDVLEPLVKVEERGARETAHRLLSICGQVFRYAVATGRIPSDPSRDLRGALARTHGRTGRDASTGATSWNACSASPARPAGTRRAGPTITTKRETASRSGGRRCRTAPGA